MSNNLGNRIQIFFSGCPEHGVIYGSQKQSSCNAMTRIMPGNNDIKSMLF